MKLFVIHRFEDRKKAKELLKTISKNSSLELSPIFLTNYGSEEWKQKANTLIAQAEAVIIYNPKLCDESDNTKWEIDKAKDANVEILELEENGRNEQSISKLNALYELKEEFEDCFSSEKKDSFELYKLMVESSESLIQRRQKTNAFFITVIGSLLAIAGLLVKTGAINNDSIYILYGFSIVGILLCNSWRNLIDNYGKLNKAKFDVILRLEKDLGAQIYSAEWVALGKGLRPRKYRSFTATEKNVPLFFGLLITVLTLITVFWKIMGAL